jgi:GAF domain-containing protein
MAAKGKISPVKPRRTIAGLEAELERRTAERDEALARESAIAEVLQVINSSPGDLAPVFDAMLDKAMRLCEAAFGELRTYDGERWHSAAIRGVPDDFAEFRKRNAAPAGPGSLGARVLGGQPIVHVLDLKDEEPYRAGDLNRRGLVDLGGARTALVASLRRDDAVLGFIILYRQEVRPFTDKQVALLQNFAAQVVIAMENARLLTETREALEQQTATAEVLQVINSSPGDLAPVFDAILQKALQLCDASFGNVVSYDGEAMTFVAEFGHREFGDWVRKNRSMQPGPTMARLVGGENVAHIEDLAATEDYRAGHALRRAHVDIGGFRRQLVVALRKDGVLLGAIAVFRQEVRSFSEKEIALLQNFAAQAVIAMENARLLGELRERTDEVADLNRGLEARVAEQVEELGRVGRLKRFLAPQLAELIVSQGDEKILESHRREIVVVFCDLRGYTAFTETAEPEEVLDFLREYHGALGPLVAEFEGTLDQFSGDGIMVFFNDPVPCPG